MLNPGTILPNKEINIEFKDQRNMVCNATLQVRFPDDHAKEKNIGILTTKVYVCYSKDNLTQKNIKELEKTQSYVGTKNLYLAYKSNNKYIIGHIKDKL